MEEGDNRGFLEGDGKGEFSSDVNATIGKPKSFNCPSCAGTVTIKAAGTTITAVCSYCSSVIDVANENYSIVSRAYLAIAPTLLEIGTRGRLSGVDWEVIGYMERTDKSGDFRWDEYLLYNPYYGFRFLVQSTGHWTFVRVLKRDIAGAGAETDLVVDDQRFRIFLLETAVVSYVKGEFYWRVKRGERSSVADYIAPPYLLSVEKNEDEINISLGEYIQPEVIKEAFQIADDMPYQMGVGANQPNPYQGKLGAIWSVAFAAFAAIFYIQLVTLISADNAEVFKQRFTLPAYHRTFSPYSLEIPKDGNVFIKSYAPVNNSWVELNLSLVNEQTNDEYEVHQSIEYYYGSEDGENWSEGKQYAESFISSVPAGIYRLLIDGDGSNVELLIGIRHDVPRWSNFFFTLFLLLIYPIYALLRHHNFESQRWSESDFAPVAYRSNDDGD